MVLMNFSQKRNNYFQTIRYVETIIIQSLIEKFYIKGNNSINKKVRSVKTRYEKWILELKIFRKKGIINEKQEKSKL